MAKDGTHRGGARPGAGRKPKPLAEKIAIGENADIPIFTHQNWQVPFFG